MEVAEFPSTLNNIERKFLHKLAEELGLHSKSKGVGENRFITVWKTGETEQNARRSELTLNEDVVKLLEASNISSFKAQKSSGGNDARGVGDVASAKKDQAFLRNSYIKAQMARLNHKDHAKIQKKRAMLPAHQHSAAVRSLVANNQIVLISGETGCGKTTQVPQFLFDDETIGSTCRMAITQPRRLSAMSVSERIASERSEKIGQTVGYNIRLETEKSENTQMLFVTPGLLIRKLQNDPLLEEFTHIIIDEAHERDRFTEFLMIVLRDVCSKRPDLKLILMSATLHTNKLSAYFGGCPHIHMGGSVFPVQEFYLENVLKYTNFLSNNQNAKGVHGDRHANTHQKTQAMSKFIEMNQSYHCSLCNTNQVFKSPEELGTHAAFCYGVSSENGTGVRSRKPSQKPNLKALFKSYHSSLPQESMKSKGSHSQDNKGAMLLNALGKNKGNKSNDVNQHSEISVSYQNRSPSPDIDVLSDGGMSDTEDILDHPGTGTDAGFVDTVSADVDETATLDNDLVREYQKLWDDNQVDYDLITALLQYVVTSEFAKTFSTTGSSSGGSILIFLPGWDDISKLHRILAVHPIFSNANKFKILQLHSGIPKQGQKEIFQSVGASQHKIILSTNIAETSVTIDDVTVVIDTGRVKEKTYDPHVKLSFLKSTWISKASARQRKGRAGRTCAGVCFHLFSKMRSKNMAEFQDSELLRMPLEELVLQVMSHLG